MDENLNYVEIIKQVFINNNWNFTTKDREKETLFNIPMASKYLPVLDVKFIVNSIGDCKIRCYLTRNMHYSKRAAILEVINTLNSNYRFITVSLDSDGDVLAAYDFTIFGSATVADKQVETMIYLVSDIIDKCVPAIMKVIWQDGDDLIPKKFN